MATTSRSTRKLRTIKAAYRRDRPQPCMRCGRDIDYDATHEHPDAFNLGHIKDWHNHPELREDPGNMQAEHAHCGKSAGTRDGRDNGLGMQTEVW